MKNLTSKTSSLTALLLAAIILLSAGLTKASDKDSQMIKKSKCAIGNLKSGITSENLGLRKNAIYFAGEYRVSEVLPELIAQLKKETDNKTKILLALVIYRIGDAEGISLVRNLAIKDSDPEVRRMCASIYTAYVNESAEEFVSINK